MRENMKEVFLVLVDVVIAGAGPVAVAVDERDV
jgi:hypothetical protein